MRNWLGLYKIVENLSPVHFKMRKETNKKDVGFLSRKSYEAI